jgi:hypothetical protein
MIVNSRSEDYCVDLMQMATALATGLASSVASACQRDRS